MRIELETGNSRVFYYAGSIEEWGRGIKLILSKEPLVSFKETGRQFITVFRRKKDNAPHGSAEKLPGNYQKTTQKILEAIGKNPEITRRELAILLGLTEDGVKFHLNNLRKNGLLRRVGPDKGGHWEIARQ